MARYKIVGMPGKNSSISRTNNTLGSIDRNIANVEAEKDETVVTNMSRGINNIFEMYKIGGKKHSQGGTPLLLPTDENDDTNGTSFIFSDSNKMKVKDPAILDYFGLDTKKPKTYAEISIPWVDAVNKSKAIILEAGTDKIKKRSAERTLENAAFKIAALKLLQESQKGLKTIPNDVSIVFDKLNVTPEEMFSIERDDAENIEQIGQAAFGGMVNNMGMRDSYYEFPSLAMSGELQKFNGGGEPGYERRKYKKDEINQSQIYTGGERKVGQYELNEDGTYSKIVAINTKPTTGTATTYDLDTWMKSSEENKNAVKYVNDLLDTLFKNNQATKNGNDISIKGNASLSFKDRILLSRVINKSGTKFGTDKYRIILQKPTEGYSRSKSGAWVGSGSFVAGFNPEDYEKRFLFEKLKANGYTSDDEAFEKIDEIYNSANTDAKLKNRKDYWNFLGLTTPTNDADMLSPNFYQKYYQTVTKAVENKLDRISYRPSMGDDGLSGFEHFDAFGFTTTPEYEIEVAKKEGAEEKAYKTTTGVPNYKGLGENKVIENPYGFRVQDINSINRAKQALFQIPKITPYARAAKAVFPETSYYSPERTLAAGQEAYNIALGNLSAFSNAQGMGAAATAIAGEAYNKAADTISAYADKNIPMKAQASQMYANLATKQNEYDAAFSTSMYDKNSALKQNFANSIAATRDKITELVNKAYDNAGNRFNLNINNEQMKLDPYLGTIYQKNQKPLIPSNASTQNAAEEFKAFRETLPTVSDEVAAKLYVGLKKGKYQVSGSNEDDEFQQPDELRNPG